LQEGLRNSLCWKVFSPFVNHAQQAVGSVDPQNLNLPLTSPKN